jgi:acetyl-CoA acetyltransferase
MTAHWLASTLELFQQKRTQGIDTPTALKTVEAGGASPIVALGQAMKLLQHSKEMNLAVVAMADAPLAMPRSELLKENNAYVLQGRADPFDDTRISLFCSCCFQSSGISLLGPLIPINYDRVAQWHMKTYGTTREQLAIVPVLMSHLASKYSQLFSHALSF